MRKTVLATAALILLTSCSSQTVDIPVVEENIKSGVEEQNNIEDVTVDCPDAVDWKKGGTFECDVKDPEGNTQKATVTMTDDDGNVSWELG